MRRFVLPDAPRRYAAGPGLNARSMHGWTAAWHDRGLRLSHDEHELVLGIPANLRDLGA